jgi:tetratricopeptide (TPR) repeat protein
MGFARIAEQGKDYATAEKEFLAAITARADSEVAYSAAGGFYRRRERWADAIGMYRKQLAAMPKDPSLTRMSNLHYGLGLSLQGSGRPDLAKPEFQAAVAANPDNANAAKALASLP